MVIALCSDKVGARSGNLTAAFIFVDGYRTHGGFRGYFAILVNNHPHPLKAHFILAAGINIIGRP